ncbi:RNA polymerase sigma factor [Pedobacter sp. JCM 36344]|uniref:RNA polymerase sigma factor n=1 Tax=Pedobacter sp. JCM 36344 TaxID=3374280 RepID=UPI00397BA7FD
MLKLEDAITGCQQNKNKAKEMIYKSFYGYLMGVILRYVSDRNDAEELVNDCFVKIFKNIVTFTFPEKPDELQKAFKGWIAKISSRTSIDFLRTKKTKVYVDDLDEHQHPVTEVNVISKLHVQDILALLDALPDTQKIIFNMYEIEGFSHDEISKILDISCSSSRVYLTRAKNRLRTLYSKSLIQSYAN